MAVAREISTKAEIFQMSEQMKAPVFFYSGTADAILKSL